MTNRYFALLFVCFSASVLAHQTSHIQADLATLERDVTSLASFLAGKPAKTRAAAKRQAQTPLSTTSTPQNLEKDLVDLDRAKYGGGDMGFAVGGVTCDYFRSLEDGTPTLVVVEKTVTMSSLMDEDGSSRPAPVTVRWWVGDVDHVTEGDCVVAPGASAVVCYVRGARYSFSGTSPHGLHVQMLGEADNKRRLYWRHELFPGGLIMDRVVASTSEFLQLYTYELRSVITRGAASSVVTGYYTPQVTAKFEAARVGVVFGLRVYAKNLQEGRMSTAAPGDKATLDLLAKACADQFTKTSEWVAKIAKIYAGVRQPVPAYTFAEAGAAARDNLKEFQAKVKALGAAGQVRLKGDAEASLRTATTATAATLTALIKAQLAGYEQDQAELIKSNPDLSVAPVIAQLDSGEAQQLLAAQLFSALSSSSAVNDMLNGVFDTASSVASRFASAFTNLMALNKRKAAVAAAIPKASLAPGEAAIVASVFDATAAADAQAAADALASKKSSFDGSVEFSATAQSLVQAVTGAYKLDLSKQGKDAAELGVTVKVSEPFSPENAKASVEVSYKTTKVTGQATITKGITARGQVLGILKGGSAKLDEVVVDTFVTYAAKDESLSSGFFATVAVPVSDAANERNTFHSGAEITLKSNVSWKPKEGAVFTAYGNLQASIAGQFQYSAGVRYEQKIKGNLNWYADAAVTGDGTFASGGRGGRDVKASVGVTFKF